jgi:NADH dehydrogenase (ubiquinone) Fe-S protein 5
MADNFAFTGPSRCFPFWQEVLACYVVNTSTEDDSGKRKCTPVLEDYYECLHHKKEVSRTRDSRLNPNHSSTPVLTSLQATRVRALQRAYRNAEAANPRDDAPKAGAIRNLGLLGQEKDTKDVLNK